MLAICRVEPNNIASEVLLSILQLSPASKNTIRLTFTAVKLKFCELGASCPHIVLVLAPSVSCILL